MHSHDVPQTWTGPWTPLTAEDLQRLQRLQSDAELAATALEAVRDTHPVRDFLIVVNLAVTVAVLAGLGFLVWAIIAGATYPPGELPVVNAPLMPTPTAVTR